MASFPAFSEAPMGFKLGPGNLCTVCKNTPLSYLPHEDEDAYPHQPNLAELEESSETCAMCALIQWAAGCSLVDYGGMISFQTLKLPSGKSISTSSMESMYNGFGMRALENGGTMLDFSPPEADYRPPIQVSLKQSFPNGTIMKNGVAKALRPWLFVNWYKSAFSGDTQSLMVGLGVRLGISGSIEDSVRVKDTVNLRGSYLRFRTDQETNFIPGRIRAADSGSPYAMEKLIEWLKVCDNHHRCISLNPPKDLPTRVLDVAAYADWVLLRETQGQKGKYVALSHSWGSTHRLTLTRSNFEDLKRGISLSDLPKTFQDAVKIARALDVPYLWIDSLCIVQNDPADWESEASQMGEVYANAYLTVAASSSKDDSTGCFPDQETRYREPFVSSDVRSTGRRCYFHAAPVVRWDEGRTLPIHISRCAWGMDEVNGETGEHLSWLYITPEWMPPSPPNHPKTYLLGEFGGKFDPIADEPLSERGWTLQERLLSPRTIHYGRTEMYWECQACVFAEDGAMIRREFTTADDLIAPEDIESGKDRTWRWLRLVEEYSKRKLTVETDKLPALSGLANLVAAKTGDTYLAGLWRSNLLNELNWAVKTVEPTHQCSDPEHDHSMPPATKSDVKYPTKYRAPSWSWASLDAEVDCFPLDSKPLTTCVNAQVTPLSTDIFGRVATGNVTLRGPLYTLSPRQFHGREGVVHKIQMGVSARWSNGEKSDGGGGSGGGGGFFSKLKKMRKTSISNNNNINNNSNDNNKNKIVREGTADFDNVASFPCFALFLDVRYAMILRQGPSGQYERIGRATFSGKVEEADTLPAPEGAVRQVTII